MNPALNIPNKIIYLEKYSFSLIIYGNMLYLA